MLLGQHVVETKHNFFFQKFLKTNEPLLGVILEQEASLFDTTEQGASHKKGHGARSQEQTNVNPGARSIKNNKKEHGTETNPKKEKNPGARGKIKKEQGAQRNENWARKRN